MLPSLNIVDLISREDVEDSRTCHALMLMASLFINVHCNDKPTFKTVKVFGV